MKFRVVFYEDDEALEEMRVEAKNEVEAEQKALKRLSSDLLEVYNQVVAYEVEGAEDCLSIQGQ